MNANPKIVRLTLQLVLDMPTDELEADRHADAICDAIKAKLENIDGIYPGHVSVLDWNGDSE